MGQADGNHHQRTDPGSEHGAASWKICDEIAGFPFGPAHRANLQRRSHAPDHYHTGDAELSLGTEWQDSAVVLGNASRTTQGSESVVLSWRQLWSGIRVSEVSRDRDRRSRACSGSDH